VWFSKLDPKLTANELQDVVKLVLFSVLPLPAELPNQSAEESAENKLLMERSLKALKEVLRELMIKDMTAATFGLIHKVRYFLHNCINEKSKQLDRPVTRQRNMSCIVENKHTNIFF